MTTHSPHAAIAATELCRECHLFEFETECAEEIIQRAIDAAVAEALAKEKHEQETNSG